MTTLVLTRHKHPPIMIHKIICIKCLSLVVSLLIALGYFNIVSTSHLQAQWPKVRTAGYVDNLIFNHKDETVFLVIDDDVYKYSDNLTLIESTASEQPTSGLRVTDREFTTNQPQNKVMTIKHSGTHLFSCWQTIALNLKCVMFKTSNLKSVTLDWSEDENDVIKTHFTEKIKADFDQTDQSLFIYISRLTHSLDVNITDSYLPALGRYSVSKTNKMYLARQSVLPYRTQHANFNLFYEYVHSFQSNAYTYFILNDIRRPMDGGLTESTSRIARICKNDTELDSYTEISLTCNANDLHAKVAYLDVAKDEPKLYVVFEKAAIAGTMVKKLDLKSYICSYSMRLIDDIFNKVVEDCNNGHQSSHLLNKLNKETDVLLICNTNPSNDWCTSKINPYIDGYSDSYKLKYDESIEISGLVSINFFHPETQGKHAKDVYFVGTETGLFTKLGSNEDHYFTIDLKTNKTRFQPTEDEKSSHTVMQKTNRTERGTKFVSTKNNVIAATPDRTIHLLNMTSCQYYNSCQVCLATRDPLSCIWCDGVCTTLDECSDNKRSTSWCKPQISKISPLSGPTTGSTKLIIEGENLGSHKANLKVKVGSQACTVDRTLSNAQTIVCYVSPVEHAQKSNVTIDVFDDYDSPGSNGSTKAVNYFEHVEVKVSGLLPPAGSVYTENQVSVYGENLSTGSNRSLLIGKSECRIESISDDAISCSLSAIAQPVAAIFDQPQEIHYFIDGMEQALDPSAFHPVGYNLTTSFRYSDSVNRLDDNSKEVYQNYRWNSIVFILIILSVITVVAFLLMHRDRFAKIFLKSSDATNQTLDSKVSFRNPDSHKFVHLNPSARISESINGLVKLSGSVVSSDYFCKPTEQIEQNKPLMNTLVDEEILNLLAHEKILVDRNKLTLGHVLGSGQFGRVYKGFLKIDNSSDHVGVAVKTLHNRCLWEDSVDNKAFLEEGLMMKDFEHENVLALIGVTFDSNGLPMVITPFMHYGDLRTYISDEASSPTVKDLIEFGIQVARGMAYLSNLRFVHRDLAARNCMLDENLVVKVADFGLSRDIYERDYYSSDNKKAKLPVKWMAIESLEKSVYSSKTDVWSYGILLWELMTRGVVPYPDVDNFDLFNYLKSGRRLLRPRYCPVILYNIMLSCWRLNPAERPIFNELVINVSNVINQLQEAKDQVGQEKVTRDDTYSDVHR